MKRNRTAYQKEYRLKNKLKHKKYLLSNKEKISKQKREYSNRNPDKLREYQKNYNKEYRKTHKTELAKRAKLYKSNRLKNDVTFRLLNNLRGRVRLALKGFHKSESTAILLGCSVEFFRSYYCSKFTSGMTWKKVMSGEIHIDHIIPCANFDLSKPSQQRKCFHYTNLQPLWAADNFKKNKF
jgi:hypothetical protein